MFLSMWRILEELKGSLLLGQAVLAIPLFKMLCDILKLYSTMSVIPGVTSKQ